jgi:CBS domain-containing protein
MPDFETSPYLLKRQKKQLLERARRVAVVGARTEPFYKSYGQTKNLIAAGLQIFPILPGVQTYLGIPCHDSLSEIPGPVDIVQIYPRREIDLLSLAKQAVQKEVQAFWVEEAPAGEEVKSLLARAKIHVVEYESLEREFHKNRQPEETSAASRERTVSVMERMTRHPITVRRDESLSAALRKMREGHFRHLPVVDEEGKLVGLLSDRDLRLIHPSLAFVPYQDAVEQLRSIPVEKASVFDPVTVRADASLEQAAELMLRWDVGGLPVIAHEAHLVGIITYSDVLREFLARTKLSPEKIDHPNED